MPEDNKTNQPETRTIFTQIVSIPLLMICVLILVAFSTLGVEIAGYFLGGHSGRPAAIYGFAAVCTFLSLWLVMGAIFAYLNIGQKKKIEVITGFYTPDTIADYFDQFWAGRDGFRTLVRHYRGALDAQKPAAADALKKQFDQMFTTDFGVKVFIIPSIIFVAAAAIVLFLGYSGGLGLAVSFGGATKPPPVLPFGIKFDLIAIAAIFGAYTWIASDAIVRCHQWTLHPSDLAWYALRMIIAVPLGQALAIAASSSATAPVPAGIGAFAAFVGSMFSLDAITRTLATAATRFGLQMNSGAEERDDLIIKLAGVDESKANALSMEGVSTIGQLVTIDPIRVSIRTGLPFEYILNLVNAALLWVFVGNTLKPLAPLGIRGASDVLALDDDWSAADTAAAALSALQKTDANLTQALLVGTAAQAALAAGQGQPADIVTPLRTDAADKAAAAVTAQQVRNDALTAYLTTVAARPGAPPVQAEMVAALVNPSSAGGPGLTKIGFDTIRARLRQSSYAVFIKKLLDA